MEAFNRKWEIQRGIFFTSRMYRVYIRRSDRINFHRREFKLPPAFLSIFRNTREIRSDPPSFCLSRQFLLFPDRFEPNYSR